MNEEKAKLIQSLKDIQGYHGIEIPFWLIVFFSVLIFLILVFWVYIKFFKKEKTNILSNYELSLKKLSELNPDENSRNFYLSYSEIIKNYLEIELERKILDRTTSELRYIFHGSEFLSSPQSLLLIETLERADMAKFAKQDINKEKKLEDLEKAKKIMLEIKETKENLIEKKNKELENELC